MEKYVPALTAALKEEQLPAPVKKENRQMTGTLYAPGPASYADT
jgi:hypothetical protein